jgi:hypothetical protein
LSGGVLRITQHMMHETGQESAAIACATPVRCRNSDQGGDVSATQGRLGRGSRLWGSIRCEEAAVRPRRYLLSREPGRESLDAGARTAATPAHRVGPEPFGASLRQMLGHTCSGAFQNRSRTPVRGSPRVASWRVRVKAVFASPHRRIAFQTVRQHVSRQLHAPIWPDGPATATRRQGSDRGWDQLRRAEPAEAHRHALVCLWRPRNPRPQDVMGLR